MIPVATIIEAAASLGTVVAFFHQAGRFSAKVDANTRATDRLTDAFEKHVEKVDERLTQHGEKLADHEARLHSLENPPGRYRESGSP